MQGPFVDKYHHNLVRGNLALSGDVTMRPACLVGLDPRGK